MNLDTIWTMNNTTGKDTKLVFLLAMQTLVHYKYVKDFREKLPLSKCTFPCVLCCDHLTANTALEESSQ